MKDLYDLAMTCIMVCIDWSALSSLATLNTLKVLSILIVLKADKLAEPDEIC